MDALRSMIFTPGHRRDLIEKAIRSGSDAVIIDLEDAVAIDLKPQARELLADLPPSAVPLFVRTNGPETGMIWDDVVAAGRAGPEPSSDRSSPRSERPRPDSRAPIPATRSKQIRGAGRCPGPHPMRCRVRPKEINSAQKYPYGQKPKMKNRHSIQRIHCVFVTADWLFARPRQNSSK